MNEVPPRWSRADAEREADISGEAVLWRGQKVYPDYRAGHTRHPEYALQQALNTRGDTR
jgi:hypothetical protein